MHKNLKISRKGITTYGQIPASVGFSATSGNSSGLTEAQLKEQAANIAAWQSNKSKPNYR